MDHIPSPEELYAFPTFPESLPPLADPEHEAIQQLMIRTDEWTRAVLFSRFKYLNYEVRRPPLFPPEPPADCELPESGHHVGAASPSLDLESSL